MVNALFQVWNSVGIVRCHTEDEISSIEVEFHDTSTHHPLHLTNHLNHTMAALSSTALLLACEAQEDSPRYFDHRLVYLCAWKAQWANGLCAGFQIKQSSFESWLGHCIVFCIV